MGGDNSPDATLKGAYLASQYLSKDETIVLVGNEKLAKSWFKSNNINSSVFEFIHADEVISMNEHATKALRKKPNNSISIGFNALKNKEIDVFSSAGNSGAVSYTHLRAHETDSYLVCRLLLEKKKSLRSKACLFSKAS